MTRRLIPITLLTGFLGAGKTTALNHLLSQDVGEKIAVIVNEFGELGIDDALIVGASEGVVEMSNGCICCSISGELNRTLLDLIKRRTPIDRVVVETTGLADPSPIALSLLKDRALVNFYALDAIVTIVDSLHAPLQLDRSPEAPRQVGFADLIALNKVDLVDEVHLEALEARVRRLNPNAQILRTRQGRVARELLLDRSGFDPRRIEADDPAFARAHSHDHDHDHDHDHHHEGDHGHEGAHDEAVTSVCLELDAPLDGARVDAWLRSLVQHHGDDIYRLKGILDLAGQSHRCVFHGIHHLIGAHLDRPWPVGAPRRSRMVFIGRALDRPMIEAGLRACLAGSQGGGA